MGMPLPGMAQMFAPLDRAVRRLDRPMDSSQTSRASVRPDRRTARDARKELHASEPDLAIPIAANYSQFGR
jgi:hypothetical protein